MHMATATKTWTLEELHSLPDDGNKYELIRGELFVTPPPTDHHETISARLSRQLDRYVAANGLGFVYHPRAVVRYQGSEVEPDLMVRQPQDQRNADWDGAPLPILIVEILSGSTRRRDHEHKRDFYMDAGVAAYWIVDPDRRCIRIIQPGVPDDIVNDTLAWTPKGMKEPFILDVQTLFT